MTDIRALQTTHREAEARCNTARKRAEEARAAAYWPGAEWGSAAAADRALEAFLTAMDARERAWRALRVAEEAINRGEVA